MSHVPPCEQPCAKCGSSTIRRLYVANNCPDAEHVRHECRVCGNWWLSRTQGEDQMHRRGIDYENYCDNVKRQMELMGTDWKPIVTIAFDWQHQYSYYDSLCRENEDLL